MIIIRGVVIRVSYSETSWYAIVTSVLDTFLVMTHFGTRYITTHRGPHFENLTILIPLAWCEFKEIYQVHVNGVLL